MELSCIWNNTWHMLWQILLLNRNSAFARRLFLVNLLGALQQETPRGVASAFPHGRVHCRILPRRAAPIPAMLSSHEKGESDKEYAVSSLDHVMAGLRRLRTYFSVCWLRALILRNSSFYGWSSCRNMRRRNHIIAKKTEIMKQFL